MQNQTHPKKAIATRRDRSGEVGVPFLKHSNRFQGVRTGLDIVKIRFGYAQLEIRESGNYAPNAGKPGGIFIRQWTKYYCIDHAEDDGSRANPQSKS